MLSTLLLQPRLMIPVFIGSRLESLTEPNPDDPLGKWINIAAIVLSLSISIASELVAPSSPDDTLVAHH